MPLVRPRYRVAVATPDPGPGYVEHEVEVTYGDQLRAEFEAGKQGLPSMKEVPQNHVTVWIWCALTRLGLYAGDCRTFRLTDVLDVQPLDENDEVPVVDPTRPAPSGSDSSSPPTTAEVPPTGSTPTSTTG